MPRAASRLAAACLLSVLPLPSVAAPVQVALDRAAVAEALRIGRSSGTVAHDPFHAAYRVPVDDPVVREVEVITEFRRLVQLTEERERLRDATWDETRAAQAVSSFRGLVDIVARLQFSPQNTYRSTPNYSLVVYGRERGGAAAILPVDSRTRPSYVAGQPAPPGTPILAATVTGTFEASRLAGSGHYLVGILLDGKEIRRVPLDLGSLR